MFHPSNYAACKNNLATEKELAKTKITTGNLSTELKSKSYEYWTKLRKIEFNSVFLDCVANSDRLGQELKVTAENLKKGLRGKIIMFYYLKLF